MNIYLGLVYCVVCIIRLYFLPDDEIKLPDEITYINDLSECKNDYWMLELYTTFSPACQRVAPVFADLSRQYGCDKLKFGKGLSKSYSTMKLKQPKYFQLMLGVIKPLLKNSASN